MELEHLKILNLESNMSAKSTRTSLGYRKGISHFSSEMEPIKKPWFYCKARKSLVGNFTLQIKLNSIPVRKYLNPFTVHGSDGWHWGQDGHHQSMWNIYLTYGKTREASMKPDGKARVKVKRLHLAPSVGQLHGSPAKWGRRFRASHLIC